MVGKSPNCQAYTQHLSVYVDGKATFTPPAGKVGPAGSSAPIEIPMEGLFSCQSGHTEAPDRVTAEHMKKQALEKLNTTYLRDRPFTATPANTSFTFETVQIGTQNSEKSAEELVASGTASNCRHSDHNEATHLVQASCRPMFDMIDHKGNAVRDYHMTFHGEVLSCDVTEAASAQLMEDVRKIAMHSAEQRGLRVQKPSDLACDYSFLPMP